ncbi:MAG TPA: hypothetical protein VE715_09050, partial [Blastocatellia bacterium]|nr:hypothetical protein [Blastocatellia bacterium]
MATPKRLIESNYARHETPYIFVRSLSWPGVKVGHLRMFPGEMGNDHLNRHHIFIPLAGSYEASMVTVGGHIARRRQTVGQASIVPAGKQYSAIWKEELEDVGVHLDPDFVAQQARELVQTDRIELIRDCEIGDPLVHQIGRSLAAEVDAGAPAGLIY